MHWKLLFCTGALAWGGKEKQSHNALGMMKIDAHELSTRHTVWSAVNKSQNHHSYTLDMMLVPWTATVEPLDLVAVTKEKCLSTMLQKI